MKRTILFLVCGAIAACNGSATSPVPADSGGGAGAATTASCSSSCESSDWPRLILGVVAPVDGSPPAEIASVEAVDAAGKAWPATVGGCPEVSGFLCSYSWAANPGDRVLAITVALEDETKVSLDVALAEHNFCAKDVAYVELNATESPRFGEPRYLSPCRRLND